MEGFNRVRGIAHDLDVAKITIAARAGPARRRGGDLRAAGGGASLGRHDRAERERGAADGPDVHAGEERPRAGAADRATTVAKTIGAAEVVADEQMGKVSIVGTGIQSAPGYAARMFRTLSEAGINIEIISTSEIRITCIIPEDSVSDAVRALHTAFELEKAEAL